MLGNGRERPAVVAQPNQSRRDERAARARDTKNRVVPDLLRSCARAKHGIARTELIPDPEPINESAAITIISTASQDQCVRPDLIIRMQPLDTLTAAARISEKTFATKRTAPAVKARPTGPNVCVLNMASGLRPGGGFLDGANSQEEFLCARTTVYASLWDRFYRLPDVSGIYTPDVLVFRDNLPEANELPKRDRYFVDVITSSMFRFADARAEGCSCGVSYCDRHRDLVLRKMKAVLRIAQRKGIRQLVLGAWGCGAHGGNPVKEIARNWRKVIAGAPRQRRPNAERWEGIEEIIFAIPDRAMLREFEAAFKDVLAPDTPPSRPTESRVDSGAELDEEDARTSELLSKIAEVEMQIEQTPNPRLRNRLRASLAELQRELSQGPNNAGASSADDLTPEDEDVVMEDFFLPASAASDDEMNVEQSFYHLADHDSDSDSSDAPNSNAYEFSPGPPGLESQTSLDEESLDECLYPALSHSPQFDPDTGWFSGSVDGLTALLKNGGAGLQGGSYDSPDSPDVVRASSVGDLGINAGTLQSYLIRYQGSDVTEY